jgi:hypothetical protein
MTMSFAVLPTISTKQKLACRGQGQGFRVRKYGITESGSSPPEDAHGSLVAQTLSQP